MPGLEAITGIGMAKPGTVDPIDDVWAKATGTVATSPTSSVNAPDFANSLANALGKVSALQSNADGLAVQAATGQLEDPHAYTVAATQAQLAMELTVNLRNKAVEAFNEIMRMQA